MNQKAEFDDVFGKSVESMVSLTDHLLGVRSSRVPTPIDKLDMVKTFIKSASMEDCQSIISELIERVSDEVGSAYDLEEAFSELGYHIRTEK